MKGQMFQRGNQLTPTQHPITTAFLAFVAREATCISAEEPILSPAQTARALLNVLKQLGYCPSTPGVHIQRQNASAMITIDRSLRTRLGLIAPQLVEIVPLCELSRLVQVALGHKIAVLAFTRDGWQEFVATVGRHNLSQPTRRVPYGGAKIRTNEQEWRNSRL